MKILLGGVYGKILDNEANETAQEKLSLVFLELNFWEKNLACENLRLYDIKYYTSMNAVAVVWVFCINYTACGLIGFAANSAVLVKLYQKRKENTVFNKTLASLSTTNTISDICFLVSGCMFIYHFVSNQISIENINILNVLQYVNRYATCISFLHVVFITVQRLAAITFPFRFKRLFTTKVVYVIIILIWITGIAIVSIYHFALTVDGDPDAALSYSIVITGAIMFFSYAWIFYLLVKRGRVSKQLTNNNSTRSDANNLKIFVNSLGLTLLFFACMFPSAILILLGSKASKLRILFASFLVFKTVCDPLMYFFTTKCSFRQRRKDEGARVRAEISMTSQTEGLGNSQKELAI